MNQIWEWELGRAHRAHKDIGWEMDRADHQSISISSLQSTACRKINGAGIIDQWFVWSVDRSMGHEGSAARCNNT